MITLYNMPLALNCYKVRLLLGLLDIKYKREPIDLLKDEHKTSKFLALNPFGQLPVLIEGDLVLRDSQAILIWITRKYGNESWMSRDPDQEAIVNGWLSAAAYELRLGPYDARLAKLFPWLCVNVNAVKQNSERALRLYEDRLKDRKWIALDHPTVADVAAFPALSQCGDGGISLDEYPAIRAWIERMRALPGFVGLLD
ncbi:MAG: glutathione S-transferase family protein [Candidatus Binataceae bacterium]|jgi:glutathione S-transferase